jgi:putative transposase
MVRRHHRKRHRGQPLAVAIRLHERWLMDFMRGMFADGRRCPLLTLVNDATRERLATEVDMSLPGMQVVQVLDRRVTDGGYPQILVTDHGREFTSRRLTAWIERCGMTRHFIAPGKPVQNAYIERCNGKFRDACSNEH